MVHVQDPGFNPQNSLGRNSKWSLAANSPGKTRPLSHNFLASCIYKTHLELCKTVITWVFRCGRFPIPNKRSLILQSQKYSAYEHIFSNIIDDEILRFFISFIGQQTPLLDNGSKYLLLLLLTLLCSILLFKALIEDKDQAMISTFTCSSFPHLVSTQQWKQPHADGKLTRQNERNSLCLLHTHGPVRERWNISCISRINKQKR